MKQPIVWVVITLIITGTLFTMLGKRSIPVVPRDIFHSSVISAAACLACHTPGRQAPLKDSHPSQTECMECHNAA